MVEEKACWICGRTEEEIEALAPDMVQGQEPDWYKSSIRHGIHVCPICQEIKVDLESDKEHIEYVKELCAEVFAALLPKVQIKPPSLYINWEDEVFKKD